MAREDSSKKEASSSGEAGSKALDPTGQTPPQSFEAGLQQLEAIVKEMESGDLPLERALQLFESGMKLSETCRRQLEEAETRVEILMKRAGSAAGEDSMQARPFRPEK